MAVELIRNYQQVAYAREFPVQPWCGIRSVGLIVALIVLFGTALWFNGYEYSLVLVTLLSCCFLLLYGRYKLPIAIINVLAFLSLFDNEFFSFGSWNLRLSYPMILVLYIYWFVTTTTRQRHTGKVTPLGFLVILTITFGLAISICFVLFDSLQGTLYNIKYWAFYWFPTILVPVYLSQDRGEVLYNFLFSLMLFITIWGMIQTLSNIYGITNFQYDWYNISPSGFFSERTWFGLFAVFGIPLVFYFYESGRIGGLGLFICFIVLLTGVLLSASRNAYLGLALCLTMFMALKTGKSLIKIQFLLGIFVAALIIIGTMSYADDDNLAGRVKFSFENVLSSLMEESESGEGRIEAARLTIRAYQTGDYSIFGNGFTHDAEIESSSTFTATGAKSANVFAFVFHIFGIIGLGLMLLLLFRIYIFSARHYRKSLAIKYSLIMMSMWLFMAQFAPVHQWGNSVVILWAIIGLFMKGRREYKALHKPVALD